MKTTKTMILTVLIAASALLTSCSKDDDNNPSIVGTWNWDSTKTESFKNGVSTGTETDTANDSNIETVTFKSDNTFTDYYKETFISNGTEVTDEGTDEGTYSIKGNVLSTTYDGTTEVEESTFTVTNTTLTVVFTYEETSGGDTYKYIDTLTYTRQ